VSGCYVVGALAAGDCPVLTPYCSGDSLVHETYVTSDDCGITESFETDCGGGGCERGECVAALPVKPKNPCPGGNGECRDEVAFACNDGSLPDTGEDCAARGLSCLEFLGSAGRVQAGCVLFPERCDATVVNGSTECRGKDIVTCQNGFPVHLSACEGLNVACAEYDASSALDVGARCTFGVECPPDGGTFCRDNIVHGCNGGDRTVQLRGCRSDVCVERNGRGLCAQSKPAPELRFLPIPGGPFRASWDEPEMTFGDFEMLEREVTVSEYDACVARGACVPPVAGCVDRRVRSDLHADLPVTCVDFPRAQEFCATLGARVPTTDQWRYALSNARSEYQFPCAPEQAPCERASRLYSPLACTGNSPNVGCSARNDVTTQGVCDLLGNVTEIVEHTPGSGVPARCGTWRGCETIDVEGLGPHQIGELAPLPSKGFRCVR
jgi:hypothetical protein